VRIRRLLPILSALSLAFPSWVRADEEAQKLGLQVGVDFASRYIWRSFDLNHGDPVVQPYLYYEPPYLEGLNADLFLSWGVAKDPAAGDDSYGVDELGLEVNYERTLGWERLKGGLGFFSFNNLSTFGQDHVGNRFDLDLKAALSLDIGAGIWLSAAYARGVVGDIRGNYVEAGLRREFVLRDDLKFAPSLVSGLLSSQYDVPNEFGHLAVTLPLTWEVGNVSISPQVFYLFIPNHDDFGPDSPNVVVGFLEVGYGF
jgi:hypothetical protein